MEEKITVVGNVATVPEQRQLPGGGAVTNFRLAATVRRYDTQTARWVDAYTNYFSVSAFRSLGEHAYRSLRKSERVVVAGKFRLREWETDAKKGVTAEIEAEAIGHDLQFGTTEFRRASSSTGTAAAGGAEPPITAQDGSASAPSSMPDAADAWATPGAERELVATGETPF
jgi:single-strand DNA-binding protein